MILVAKAYLENRPVDFVNELGNGKASTGKRLLLEFEKRISKLTMQQLTLLANGDFETQKQIAYLSVCKTYGFIRDFAVAVLREKYLVFDHQISEGDYISFYRRTNDLHPEMDGFTEQTIKKLRQVTFKILEQAGLIDAVRNRVIIPQIVDSNVTKAIIHDNPEWLKVFLMSDIDMNALINE
jgi:Ni,Fe-hydrogenase I large subunit